MANILTYVNVAGSSGLPGAITFLGHTRVVGSSNDWASYDPAGNLLAIVMGPNDVTGMTASSYIYRQKLYNYMFGGGIVILLSNYGGGGTSYYDDMMEHWFAFETVSTILGNDGVGSTIMPGKAQSPFFSTPYDISTLFASITTCTGHDISNLHRAIGFTPLLYHASDSPTRDSCFYKRIGAGLLFIYLEPSAATLGGTAGQAQQIYANMIQFSADLVDGDIEGTPGQDGADEAGFFCRPRGSIVETDAPDAPFGPAVCLDYDAGKAYRWDHLPFTCGLFVASGCSAPAEIPDTNYFGGRGGWVYAFGQEAVYSDGLWEGETARFTITAGDANSFTVASGLSTYGDGLKGVVASLVKNEGTSSESIQERTILFNSSTKGIICDPLTGEGSAWTSNPAAGDILYLGLITTYVEFPEIQTQRESYLGSIRPFIINDSGQTAYFKLETWGATSRNKWADATGAADGTRYFDDTEVNAEPEGIRPTPVDGGKAHRHRLTMRQPPGGEMVIVPGGQFADDGAIEADLIT